MQQSSSSVVKEIRSSRRGRRLLGLLAILLFMCAMSGIVAAAVKLGAQAGTAEYGVHATSTSSAQVVEWFLRGMDLLKQGNYQLAEANFQAVLKAQPDNIGVQQLLATARVAQTPTIVPPTPTPTPVSIITDKGKLLDEMKAASDRQIWDTVINLADQLRALDSNYESATVDALRFKALVARGTDRLNKGELEAGLYDLDRAALIHNLDSVTQSQRQLASMYQNAINYLGADWDKAIELLKQLYAIQPRYRDVGRRLLEAYVQSGDAYAAMMDWCPAESHYAGAISMASNPQLEQKRTEAQQKCLTATPVGITGTLGTATGQGAQGLAGRIIFAALNPASGAYQLQEYNAAAATINTIEVGGSQPAYQRGTGIVAYSFGSVIHGYNSGSILAVSNAGGAWPSLSPDGTRVAYAVFQSDSWNIYIAPVNGSAPPAKLIQGSYPVWGPTNRIAFEGCINGQCGIYTVNPDQPDDRQKVTTSAGDISMQWSPDGSRLVYMTNFTGNWEIYTVALANGQFRQITNGTGLSVVPTWSPDGSRIAFESNRDGSWGIYVVGSEGGNAQKIINIGPNHPAWQSERLAWAP